MKSYKELFILAASLLVASCANDQSTSTQGSSEIVSKTDSSKGPHTVTPPTASKMSEFSKEEFAWDQGLVQLLKEKFGLTIPAIDIGEYSFGGPKKRRVSLTKATPRISLNLATNTKKNSMSQITSPAIAGDAFVIASFLSIHRCMHKTNQSQGW